MLNQETGVGIVPASDGPLPDLVDERFAALVLDYFADHNVIVAQGSGARAVLELLVGPDEIKGRAIVFYADTADDSWGYARKLKGGSCHELRIFPTTLSVLMELKAFLSCEIRPTRLYAAGSKRFVQLIGELAVDAGLDSEFIRVERVDPDALRITCGACLSLGDYYMSEQIFCGSCGTGIVATRFYCDETHSFWGKVATSKTVER